VRRVRYTILAREDLLDIWVHIAPHNPQVADRVLDRIEDNCRRLRDYPQMAPARPDIAPDARGLVIERWIALYRLTDDGVQIVRVADTARDLTKLDWPPDEGEA